MKLVEVCRFEIAYQSRRAWTWLHFAALVALTYLMTTEAFIGGARRGGYFFNVSFVVASVAVVGSAMALLAVAASAGDAAARDPQTLMQPLVYVTPVGKTAYLAGRFVAAFLLGALAVLAVFGGLLLASLAPGLEPALLGPFRPAAYLGPCLSIALPNIFISTALMFSLAALSRRAAASYLGGLLVFGGSMFSWLVLAGRLGQWKLAKLLDPLNFTVMSELSKSWTPAQKNELVIGLQGSMIANRLLWISVSVGVLALLHARFRLAHHAPRSRSSRVFAAAVRRLTIGRADAPASLAGQLARDATVQPLRRDAGGANGHATAKYVTRLHQAIAVARESFSVIVIGWGGLALAALAAVIVLSGPVWFQHLGVPLLPTTARVTQFLAVPLANPGEAIWMVVPLLVAFYAAELVWRERDARASEIIDTAPVPDWVFLLGKFLGLAMVLVTVQALMMAAGMLIQVRLGYYHFETALYLRILFGLQLPDYLLFAVLALAVHVWADQKYVGHLVVALAYGTIAFGSELGFEEHLLIYASDPGWSYSDVRGLEPFLRPWLFFTLYWAAWALLLALAARLFWVRGREAGFGWRVDLARRRLSRTSALIGFAAFAAILVLGGYIFHETHLIDGDEAASTRHEDRAEYERRYARYRGVAQPRLTSVKLLVELYPERPGADIRATFVLVNESTTPIDSIHLSLPPAAEVVGLRFDRRASSVLSDERLRHRVYRLASPLRPGDSLTIEWQLRSRRRGFLNRAAESLVVANGTCLLASEWLPAVGYQPGRELSGVGVRRAYGLPPRPEMPPLEDEEARGALAGSEPVLLDAVVGTSEGQVAVAPGRLHGTWAANGRRYFRYRTDSPVRNDYAVFSAAYAERQARWNDIAIQVLHHPSHAWNVDGMVRSIQASLSSYTRRFGPYPQKEIRLVERPGSQTELHAYPVNIAYQEGFAAFDPAGNQRGLDFPFAVVAHEVAHQWWGNQLSPAPVEGGALLTESLAWYSALGVVEEYQGRTQLDRLLDVMREAYLTPRSRAGEPLLRASSRFLAYRKGPFVMHALREYVGADRVDAALRRLLQSHPLGSVPLATSLDLYRELRAVTPVSLHSLLTDLFETNTYWELSARQARAVQTGSGMWQVILDVQARKVVVDSAGAEKPAPMDDLVEIGVFGAPGDGGRGEPLYLRLHRLRAGAQRITITVPRRPAEAGIDPRKLLIDVEPGNNRVSTELDARGPRVGG